MSKSISLLPTKKILLILLTSSPIMIRHDIANGPAFRLCPPWLLASLAPLYRPVNLACGKATWLLLASHQPHVLTVADFSLLSTFKILKRPALDFKRHFLLRKLQETTSLGAEETLASPQSYWPPTRPTKRNVCLAVIQYRAFEVEGWNLSLRGSHSIQLQRPDDCHPVQMRWVWVGVIRHFTPFHDDYTVRGFFPRAPLLRVGGLNADLLQGSMPIPKRGTYHCDRILFAHFLFKLSPCSEWVSALSTWGPADKLSCVRVVVLLCFTFILSTRLIFEVRCI